MLFWRLHCIFREPFIFRFFTAEERSFFCVLPLMDSSTAAAASSAPQSLPSPLHPPPLVSHQTCTLTSPPTQVLWTWPSCYSCTSSACRSPSSPSPSSAASQPWAAATSTSSPCCCARCPLQTSRRCTPCSSCSTAWRRTPTQTR